MRQIFMTALITGLAVCYGGEPAHADLLGAASDAVEATIKTEDGPAVATDEKAAAVATDEKAAAVATDEKAAAEQDKEVGSADIVGSVKNTLGEVKDVQPPAVPSTPKLP